jgi:drug/metabolite transporter (DMT)-like permease
MKPRDVIDLLLLAALWGASFLFTRIATPAFGPFAIAELRIAIAAAVLLALLAWRGGLRELAPNVGRLVFLGSVNSAIPFALFAYAALSITAGMAAIINATASLFGALVAWLWLRERLTALQWLGVAIGFAGVLWLTGGKSGFQLGGTGLAILAGLVATFSYGIAANATKHYLSGVRPLAIAAGSQSAAAVLLLPFSIAAWPDLPPTPLDWLSVVALGVFCTGLAYILYFRLIARVGPAKTMTVAYLIPAFAMLWGALFLAETVTPAMLAGCAVILVGTSLATGLVRRR